MASSQSGYLTRPGGAGAGAGVGHGGYRSSRGGGGGGTPSRGASSQTVGKGSAAEAAPATPVKKEWPADQKFVVTVHVDSVPTPIKVPCGPGLQKARWLAGVVMQRAARSPHTKGGRLVPRGLCTMDGAMISPSSKLRDVLPEPNASVRLKLQTEVAHRPDGGVSLTPWQADAFVVSDSGKARAEKQRQAMAEEKKQQVHEQVAQQQVQAETAYHDGLHRLLCVDIESNQELHEAASQEWPHVNFTGYCYDAEQEQELKRLILVHFVRLSDLYKYFCGSVEDDSIETMCRMEFNHFLAMSRVLDPVKERSTADGAFAAAHGRTVMVGDHPIVVLSRFQFIQALVDIAFRKSPTTRIASSFGKLLEDRLIPASKKLVTSEAREAMRNRNVVRIMGKNWGMLRRVFDMYRVKDTAADDVEELFSISLSEFSMLLADSKLFESDSDENTAEEFTPLDARQIFTLVQQRGLSDEFANAEPRGPPRNTLSELVFSEFVEAILCVACERFVSEEKIETQLELTLAALRGVDPDPVEDARAEAEYLRKQAQRTISAATVKGTASARKPMQFM